MLEVILDKYVIYVLMGVFAVLGILSKLIVSITLRRMVYAAGNMSKSTHPLMRLTRAKFEHACMISEKVENVRVFVEKYLYEYRVMGVKLHSLRRMELTAAGMCLVLGMAGAAMEYRVQGFSNEMATIGVTGVVLGGIVLLVHFITDENYRLEAVRNYMVDYLENICLHRYEKAYQRENMAEIREREDKVEAVLKEDLNKELVGELVEELVEKPVEQPVKNVAESVAEEITERPVCSQPVTVEENVAEKPMGGTTPERVMTARKTVKKEKKEENKDILIRQILEEFMA